MGLSILDADDLELEVDLPEEELFGGGDLERWREDLLELDLWDLDEEDELLDDDLSVSLLELLLLLE